MTTLLTILHVIVSLFLILTVLLQSGKGGGMGAAFGGGNAATVFGGSGASSFLRRLTAGAATLFMLASMVLAYIASHNSGDALEKFGEQQSDLAKKKEDAKNSVLNGSGGSASGSAGSASGSATSTMMSPGSASEMPTPDMPTGSATAPATPPSGSATAPATKTPATKTPEPSKVQDKPVAPPAKTPEPSKQDKPVAP
jgi:preprotein translocase subunit SecG